MNGLKVGQRWKMPDGEVRRVVGLEADGLIVEAEVVAPLPRSKYTASSITRGTLLKEEPAPTPRFFNGRPRGATAEQEALYQIHELLIGDDSIDPLRAPCEAVEAVRRMAEDEQERGDMLWAVWQRLSLPGDLVGKRDICAAVEDQLDRIIGFSRKPLALIAAHSEAFQ